MNPTKTEWMKKQMEHEPTREWSEDISRLVTKFPYEYALEIGCAWGVSTLALLNSGNGFLTSVDKSYYKEPVGEVEANGFEDRWDYIVMDSKDYWEQPISMLYDLVFIDGSHSYEYVKADIKGAWERLKKGGVMILDDSTHKYNQPNSDDPYGVAIAALQFWREHPKIKAGYEGSLLWMKKTV